MNRAPRRVHNRAERSKTHARMIKLAEAAFSAVFQLDASIAYLNRVKHRKDAQKEKQQKGFPVV